MKARWFPLLGALVFASTGCRVFEKWQRERDRPSANPASRPKDPDWLRDRNRNSDSPYELPRDRAPKREPGNLLDPPNVPSSSVRTPSAGTWADPASKNFDVRGAAERILAGRVETPDGQVVENAFVALEHADPTKNAPGAQVGVQTDRNGTFLIQGLKSGDTYLLTASVRGWVGKQYVTVPNQRVRIVLRDDFAVPPQGAGSAGDLPGTPSIPPPGNVTAPPLFDTPRGEVLPYPNANDGNFTPITPARPDLIAPGPQPGFRSIAPPAAIPGPSVPPIQPPPAGGSTSKSPDRRSDLRLLDRDGRDRAIPSGRRDDLVLLNFSSTNCVHCVKAIPTLARLHDDYRGLEVLTVLCDEGSTNERLRAAERYRSKHKLAYDVAVEAKAGEIQTAYHVEGYPSLVLVDGTGRTLWEGHPKESSRLERILRDRLANR
ncbi:MAG: carboxypeptidase regulatory-like domain-containing protein [Gemmataceae bacterium]|nr:carboxypeptidase regulatory-like domain-containing protein [Planctomycetia bacterium]MBX3401291.1 carboxypeptidase regulatory-like domain-containing protein [Gemmataceae bacterium]